MDSNRRLSPSKALTSPLSLGASDTLKLSLTTQEGSTAKRPHQAFLLLQDPTTKLDISYPFNVKDSGKAKLELVRNQPSSPPIYTSHFQHQTAPSYPHAHPQSALPQKESQSLTANTTPKKRPTKISPPNSCTPRRL